MLRATLKEEQHQNEGLVPALCNVTVSRCFDRLIWFNGYQFMDKAWYFQRWRCRLVNAQEAYVAALKNGRIDPSPEIPTYRHWWSVLDEARRTPEHRQGIDIADAISLLEIDLCDVWAFVEWISATERGYSGGPGIGKDGLGRITFKHVEPCDGIPRDTRYGEIAPSR